MATATSPAEQEEALQNLLISLFDAESLRQWVRIALGPDTHAELPGQEVSLATLAFQVVLAVRARGLASNAMFDSLSARRPAREADIRKVAQLWLVEPGSVAPNPRRPSARDTVGSSVSVASAVPIVSLASGAILAFTERPLVLSLICIGLCPILTAHSVESIRGRGSQEREARSGNKLLYVIGLLIMVIPSLCFGMFEGWATDLTSGDSRGTFAGYASIAVLLSLFIRSGLFMSYSSFTFRLAMGAALLGVGAISLSAYASSTSIEVSRGVLHRSRTEPAAPAALQVDASGVDPKDRASETQAFGPETDMDDAPGAIQQPGQQPGTVESQRGPAAGKLKTGGGQGRKSDASPCPDSPLTEAAAGDGLREGIQVVVLTLMKENKTMAMEAKELIIQILKDESITTIEESTLDDVSGKNASKTTYIMDAALHPPVWSSAGGMLSCKVSLALADADRSMFGFLHEGGRLEPERRASATGQPKDDALVSECFALVLNHMIPCKFVPAMLQIHGKAQAE